MKAHRELPQEEALKEQFAQLLADLKKTESIHEFLSMLLTEGEYSMLARRIEVLRRLQAKQSYLTIQRELAVSSATVAAISQLQHLDFMKDVLKRVEKIAKKTGGWFGL
ncbi:hypothetical protein KA012_01360 [Candidatus Woesebacteria bacterium]|nr:hypothetical protein [Candidatus Woesebacteria bacterium]